MTRQRHGDAPVRKKASKKAPSKTGRSLLQRAAAKKRAKSASSSMAPTKVAPSQDKRLGVDIVYEKPGEHPSDTIHRASKNLKGATNPRSPIEDERAEFRRGPLSEDTIADICRMLRFSLHRETVERLLGLSRGRIKKWIRRGKESREAIEAWHDQHDDLVQEGRTSAQAMKSIGREPDFNMYATFHACVLLAEAEGEKTAVASIIEASIGGNGRPSDWKASSWLLSRKYNKRWGSYAERQMNEEEDFVDGNEASKRSAVDRLADTLDEMFGKSREQEDV